MSELPVRREQAPGPDFGNSVPTRGLGDAHKGVTIHPDCIPEHTPETAHEDGLTVSEY